MCGAGGPPGDAARQWDRARAFALSFPQAFEDFPWGVPAIKVATGSRWPPLFLWLGRRDAEEPAVYVKLTDSYEQAVAVAGATPTAMSGVGQWGRLTVPLPVGDLDLLFDWVDESYRNVAPGRLVALLDRNPPSGHEAQVHVEPRNHGHRRRRGDGLPRRP